MVNKLSISDLKKYLSHIFQSHPVELAYLYGSVAEGQTTQFSDIDIAIVSTPGTILPLERLRFELMLENEIADHCHLDNADVRVIDDAPLALRGHIVTQGILLYARSETFRIEFETSTRLEYFDFQPVLELLRTSFFETVLKKGINDQRTKDRRDASQLERIPGLPT